MGTLIIGFGNRARTGKDYCANYMKSLLNDKAHILSFAGKLKEIVENKNRIQPLVVYSNDTYFLLHENQYYPYHKSKVPLLDKIFNERKINIYYGMDEKDREILQFWGTDFIRNFIDKDYWVKEVEKQIKNIEKNQENPIILIPDVRFLNEYNFIKNNNGMYIKVLKTDENENLIFEKDEWSKHPSEQELDNIQADYTIKAKKGDLETLQSACFVILKRKGLI